MKLDRLKLGSKLTHGNSGERKWVLQKFTERTLMTLTDPSLHGLHSKQHIGVFSSRLASLRKILRLNGGRLEVYSQLGC